jgi:hypothetical protein
MSVDISWSLTNGGAEISTTVDSGSLANGTSSGGTVIYVRHDGVVDITNARFYLSPFTGTYLGGATAVADHDEFLAWGDGITADTFGGFQVNMNAIVVPPATAFPDLNWPTVDVKAPTDGVVAQTGTADRSNNAVVLTANTGCSSAGVLPAGSSPNVRFKFRVAIPASVVTTGIRMWDQVLLYTYTS